MLQSLGVANCSLAKQFLEFPTVVQRPLHFGHEVIGDINGQSTSFQTDVEEMARVLFPLQAGLALLANAGTPAQAERAQSCWPPEPDRDSKGLVRYLGGGYFGRNPSIELSDDVIARFLSGDLDN